MIKKTKLFFIIGIALLVNSFICIGAFIGTYKDKKKLSAAFWALAVALGSAGAAVMAVYASLEHMRISDLKKAIAKKDHWFHSFEYPECNEPEVSIEETYFDPVETEDDETLSEEETMAV